jgi:NAD-dependent DNA ligase
MHIVVTGRCPDLDRVYLYNMLGSMDAVVTEHVSSSETILLAFDPGKNTRKIKDARAFGCRIVDETGMLNTILTAMALDHAARATVLSVESIRPLESLS